MTKTTAEQELGVYILTQDTKKIQDIIDKQLKINDPYEILYKAVRTKNIRIVKMILDCKIDINATRSNGSTALFGATFEGGEEIVKLLINSGAIVDIANKFGFTPLHYAAYLPSTKIAELYLKHGAKPNAVWERDENQGYTNVTPLHIAARCKNMPMLRLLISKGGDIHKKSGIIDYISGEDMGAEHQKTIEEICIKNGSGNEFLQIKQDQNIAELSQKNQELAVDSKKLDSQNSPTSNNTESLTSSDPDFEELVKKKKRNISIITPEIGTKEDVHIGNLPLDNTHKRSKPNPNTGKDR